jgi:AcrR family transcriptional regulator
LSTLPSETSVTVAEPAPKPAARPLRADAARNRESILAAARETFAEEGLNAQMEEIARRAGVGVGTLYRRFPTKEALVEALVEDYFAAIDNEARAALEVDDPWEAFTGYMWRAAELLGENRALSEITADGQMREGARRQGVDERVGELIRRAQRAGAMRPDLSVEDVPMIMCSLGRVQMLGGRPESWRRHLSIMLDGMRAAGASAMPD